MQDLLLIDHLLTAEEREIRANLETWVADYAQPLVIDAYEQGYFPMSLVAELAKLGILGATLPTNVGGAGLGYVAYGLICQALEQADSGIRSFVSVQSSLCMYPIWRYGSESQQQTYLASMAKGELIGCFGLTEPNAGSDPSSMTTNAVRQGDGWLLNGCKQWITNAPIADIAIVWAKTHEGITGFIVPKDTPGFNVTTIHQKLSMRMSSTGTLFFNDCYISEANRLPSAKGLGAPLSCLTQARYGIAWGAIGAAMRCLDIALEYTQERMQFGMPLAKKQLVQYQLADMYNEITKAQLMNLRVGRLREQGEEDPVRVSLIKMNACKEALKIAREARNLLGGNGITLEYQVMRHAQNLETVFTYEGADNIHHLIVGHYLTGLNAF